MFENFDNVTFPTVNPPTPFLYQIPNSLRFYTLTGTGESKIELIQNGESYGGTGKSLRTTYPAFAPGEFRAPWSGIDIPEYNTNNVYLRFRAKMPKAKHGLKFVKIFGQRDNDNYANSTFGLDYTGTDFGGMYQTSFGDGSSAINDTASVIGLEGYYNIGRAQGLPGVNILTPQNKAFTSSDWGNDWHLFELYVKFNSGNSPATEKNDGEYQVKIDGKVYVDAKGLFNRHYTNKPIATIELLGWTQTIPGHSVSEFEIWYDDIELSINGWGNHNYGSPVNNNSSSSSSNSTSKSSSSFSTSSSKSSSSLSSLSSSSIKSSSSQSSISNSGGQAFYLESFEGNSQSGGGANFSWSGGAWSFVVNDAPKTGTKSLRFRYPSGANTSAEERFVFTVPRQEVWIRYWLRVPTNFEHVAPEPHWATNNKLFALWMDDYSAHGKGPSVIWEYWDNGQGGSDIAVHYSEGNNTGAGPHLQFQPFINASTDKGRWMQLVLHVKAATKTNSGASNNDGLIETYRKWNGDSGYVRLHQVTDANIAPPVTGPLGWQAGYFMGWSNPGFSAQTDFYIDDIEFADTMNLNN